MAVVIDGKKTVGYLAPAMDGALGAIRAQAARG